MRAAFRCRWLRPPATTDSERLGPNEPGRPCLRASAKGPDGDRINAVLAAAGFNFSLLLRWLADILRACILALSRIAPAAEST